VSDEREWPWITGDGFPIGVRHGMDTFAVEVTRTDIVTLYAENPETAIEFATLVAHKQRGPYKRALAGARVNPGKATGRVVSSSQGFQ
jgi:hypothetical protein